MAYYPLLVKGTYIDSSAVIGGDITIADDVSIWPLVAARGDVNRIYLSVSEPIFKTVQCYMLREKENIILMVFL